MYSCVRELAADGTFDLRAGRHGYRCEWCRLMAWSLLIWEVSADRMVTTGASVAGVMELRDKGSKAVHPQWLTLLDDI